MSYNSVRESVMASMCAQGSATTTPGYTPPLSCSSTHHRHSWRFHGHGCSKRPTYLIQCNSEQPVIMTQIPTRQQQGSNKAATHMHTPNHAQEADPSTHTLAISSVKRPRDPPPTATPGSCAVTAFLIALIAVGGTPAPRNSFTTAPSATTQGSWLAGGATGPDPDGHSRVVATASTTAPSVPLPDSTSINVTPSKEPAGGDVGCRGSRDGMGAIAFTATNYRYCRVYHVSTSMIDKQKHTGCWTRTCTN